MSFVVDVTPRARGTLDRAPTPAVPKDYNAAKSYVMAQQARQPAQQKTAQTMRKPTQSRIHQTVSSFLFIIAAL